MYDIGLASGKCTLYSVYSMNSVRMHRACTILGWSARSVHCVLYELSAHVQGMYNIGLVSEKSTLLHELCAHVQGMYGIGLASGKCTLHTP